VEPEEPSLDRAVSVEDDVADDSDELDAVVDGFEADPESDPESAPPDVFAEPGAGVPSSFALALARELEPRSFFAHPEPLKWTDGAEKTFVIVPSTPHSGQKWGPSAAIP
jgi:hypothetical protein